MLCLPWAAQARQQTRCCQGVASLAGGDPSAFSSILDLREGRLKEKELDIEATLQMYLEFVEVVTNYVCAKMNLEFAIA